MRGRWAESDDRAYVVGSEVRELGDDAGCYRGALDWRTAPVLATDIILVGRPSLRGPVVVVQRMGPAGPERFVAERRALPGDHWLYVPCAEGLEPLTSYDPDVSVVGVVVEIRRRFVEPDV